jgi:polysaccharide deacetylase family protein (PEP-CTERM system associated)
VGLTDLILRFLGQHEAKATFFVVGAVAERHPDLIERIAADGHEIGLHTVGHKRLAELGRAGFEDDTRRGLELLSRFAPDGRIFGFRAPFFSLSEDTGWAFDVLRELDFVYDSSVLPVWNPVCGYHPEQSEFVHRMDNGLWSVPVSVLSFTRRLGIPVAGGVYLRLLPEWVNRWAARRYREAGEPMNVYFHPYDVQPNAPTGAVFGHNAVLNSILRLRRGAMLPRLHRMIGERKTWRVIDYIRSRENGAPGSNGR